MTATPFSWIPQPKRRPVFITTAALATVLFAARMLLDRSLRTAAAPSGIGGAR